MSDTMTIPQCPFPFVRRTTKKVFGPCVYLLTLNGVVRYIGSTNRLHERDGDCVRSHYQHDATWYLRTGTRGEAYDCEYWLIENVPTVHNGLRAARRNKYVPYPPFFLYGHKISFAPTEANNAAA